MQLNTGLNLNTNINIERLVVINHKNIFDTSELPVISISTKKVFEEAGEKTPNFITYPLNNKVEAFKNSIQKLEQLEAHPNQNKIIGIVKGALYVAIVATGVFGTFTLGPIYPVISAFLFIGTLMAAAIMATILAEGVGFKDLNGEELILLIWIAPFFPIYEEFTKLSKIKKQVNKQQKEIEDKIKELKAYFNDDLSKLREMMIKTIENAKETLKGLTNLPIYTETGYKEIEMMKSNYELALMELDKAVEFYNHI